MTRQRPHIDEILAEFIPRLLEAKTGLRRRRMETAEQHLRRCLEEDGHSVLTDGDKFLLESEREFAPDGAFARTMHADDLVFALNIYVRDPWLLADRLERAVQLRLAESLTAMVLQRRLVDEQELVCPLLDLRSGLDAAGLELKRERRAARSG
jgi:hypothetical protein